jgi:hypothetical protein
MAEIDGTREHPIPLPRGFVELTFDLQSIHQGAFRLFTRANRSARWIEFKQGPLQDTTWIVDASVLRPGLKYAIAWLRSSDKLKAAIIVRSVEGGAPVMASIGAAANAGLVDGEVHFE